MGFVTGYFLDDRSTGASLPPWLSGVRCSVQEADIGACRRSTFGDTSSCGATQRMFCLPSRMTPQNYAELASLGLPMSSVCSMSP